MKYSQGLKRILNVTDGILNLYKPVGITSFAATNRVRRLFSCKKAGHCGTLDPNASGVLLVLLGNAVKAAEFIVTQEKSYKAVLVTGFETDTGDITGKVTRTSGPAVPDYNSVRAAAKSFEGGYFQTPPMYSALKVNGKKLVDEARKGRVIEREPRFVGIENIDAELEDGEYRLSVTCQKGTYIRTLCEDIGRKLGTCACMGSLERTRVGGFTSANAVTPEFLTSLSETERQSFVKPIDTALEHMRKVNIEDFFAALIKTGNAVETRKLGFTCTELGFVRLYSGGSMFAIGEVFEAGGKRLLKHKKLFI